MVTNFLLITNKLQVEKPNRRGAEGQVILYVRVTVIEVAYEGVKVTFRVVSEQQNDILVAEPKSWRQRMR